MEGVIGDDALKYSKGLRIALLSEMAEPYETVSLNKDRIQRQGAFELSLCIFVAALAKIQLTELLPHIDVVTACAQSCPADALVFGDLNDPDSRVSRLSRSGRAYRELEDTGAKPKVVYLKPGGDE